MLEVELEDHDWSPGEFNTSVRKMLSWNNYAPRAMCFEEFLTNQKTK